MITRYRAGRSLVISVIALARSFSGIVPHDLAIVANFVVTSDRDERTYLEEYFGQPPDEYQLARFFLMRQVMHMLSAAVFLLLGSAGKPILQNKNPPSFRDFHGRVWAGEIDLADNNLKVVYGIVHWEQFLQNGRQPPM